MKIPMPFMSYDIFISIISVFIGALLVWLWHRSVLQREKEILKIQLAEKRISHDAVTERLRSLEPAYKDVQDENQRLKIKIAHLNQAQTADAEKIQWIEQAQSQMREAFEALAGRTLQQNADIFAKHAEENISALMNQARGDWKTHKAELQNIVDPVRENLTMLDTHVRELEQKREGAYQGVIEQLNQLSRANAEIRSAAITLTQALKSPVVRGQWGEMQLRRVVELAGMMRHVAFSEQINTDRGRPDMIIHLPNSGILPVDSKAPLQSYLEAVEAYDENTRKIKMGNHAKAMRNRIRELSQKKYWAQFANAPEFVVMFIPSEACLSAAFENDPDLLEYAIEQKILAASPVTLIALLKSASYGWKQHEITENAHHIAEQGHELYKRLENFASHLSDIGNHLNKAVEGYNLSIGSFERRLLPSARRFQEMNIAESELTAPQRIEISARASSVFKENPVQDILFENPEKNETSRKFSPYPVSER